MLVARSRPASAGSAGRCRAASRPADAMLLSQKMPAPHRDCRIAHRARDGGAAKSLNRFHLLLPTTSTSTPTSSTATAASSSAGLALLALSGAAAQASQSHPWGARLSSPLVAMLLGGVAAAAFPSVLSSSSASSAAASAASAAGGGLPSAVSGTLVPLAACLALLEIEEDEDDDDGDDDESSDGGKSLGLEEKPNEGEGRKDDRTADPTLAVSASFALASLATVAATLAAVSLCFFVRNASSPPQLPFLSFFLPSEALLPGPLLVKVAACLCASYVGGSVNFAATAASLGLSSSAQGAQAMTAAFAADLVAMALYFGALAALRVSKQEEEWARGGIGGGGGEASSSSSSDSSNSSSSSSSPSSSISTLSAALSLAAASCSVALGEAVAAALGCPSASLAVAALVASAFGVLACRQAATRKKTPSHLSSRLPRLPPRPFAGASAASSSLMLLFFASCGAQAGSPSSLRAAASLGGFVALLLSLQLAATLALGRGGVSFSFFGGRRRSPLPPPLSLPLPALVVGANAAVGGPGTAAAAAAARSWGRLVRPAVLTGSAGYAIGTGVGVGVAAVLSRAFC